MIDGQTNWHYDYEGPAGKGSVSTRATPRTMSVRVCTKLAEIIDAAQAGHTPLERYANARLLLYANQVPGVLESPRTGRFLFEAFLKRLRQISSKENSPGVDTGDFTYEGYLTRGAVLPLTPSQPWDWLATNVAWSTSGIRPVSVTTPALLTPCFGAVWLGPLTELRTPGLLPSPSRGQLAAFSVTEFGGLYGAGGIGSLTQPLLWVEQMLSAA